MDRRQYNPDHWFNHLNTKETRILFLLYLKLNANNKIVLSDNKQLFQICDYSNSNLFKKHYNRLLDIGIVFECQKNYFINPFYVEPRRIGPKMHNENLIDKGLMKEVLKTTYLRTGKLRRESISNLLHKLQQQKRAKN
ncbi:hypothetical protein AAGG74_14885 [Bacillus mexicanus]|uniref:hypothetical protein n=1 Tax=Bacillus mexicanus TaxID=2834415 RepID=UPI003D21783A